MAADSEKTERIGYLCLTIVVLGMMFTAVKLNACQSCNKPDPPEVCRDEFVPIDSERHSCTPGARAEVVTSPPAPKAGLLCHCENKPQPSNDPQPTPQPSK
jgi:hypothetical protein